MTGLLHTNTIYMIGIGGIGMSALARYFLSLGKEVSGYDRSPTPLTAALEGEGINIHYMDDPAYIPCDAGLVIYTPAIPPDNKELLYCREHGFALMKRAEVLGEIAAGYKTIAVAGTHGKTSITSMITHIMHHGGVAVTALLGGIMQDYDTNFIGTANSRYLVAEADEYDRSFLKLSPSIAVISSMAADHLDIYGSVEEMMLSFGEFTKKIRPGGTLIIHERIAGRLSLPEGTIIYGENKGARLKISDIRIEGHHYLFTLKSENGPISIRMKVPGRHNIENAAAAAAACMKAGMGPEAVKAGLETYPGVKRRFEFVRETEETIFIDDYAHHPDEIKACINTARELFPGKKITGVFQPHLYSRTRDLAMDFALSLSLLDELILLDIYPAREKPIEGVNAGMLLQMTALKEKSLVPKQDLVTTILQKRPEVLITMGAGDIDQLVKPIKTALFKTK
jgi:UDP-N-acetylmuramate--alanine ligase